MGGRLVVQASRLPAVDAQAGRLHHKRGMSPATSLALAPGFRPMTKEQLLKMLKPVALGDKPLFDRYFSQYPPTVSELTFTNVFCWAEVRHHLFCEHQGHLLICYR